MDLKTNLYLFILKLSRHKRYHYFNLLKEILYNRKVIEFQREALLKLLCHCEKYVPYYRKIFKEINYSPVKEGLVLEKFIKIPPLDKPTIRKNRDLLLSEFFPTKELIKETTGGSTGEPLNIFVSKDTIEWNRAGEWCRHFLGGWKFGDKIAFFWGNPRDIEVYKKFKKKILFWLSNRLILNAFDMDDNEMGRWYKKIKKFRPKFFYGYASAIAKFAKYCLKNNLQIHGIQGVFSTAETLFPQDKEIIQKAFNCPVYNQYGSRETTAIAAECKHNVMHVLPLVYLENEIPGEKSELLVTSLVNYAMPLLRYKIGDIGKVILTPFCCKCGIVSQSLELEFGRKFEFISLPDGRILHGLRFYYALYYLEGISKYQFRQKTKKDMELLIVRNELFNQETEEKLIQFKELCRKEYGIDLHIKFVDEIPVSPSGKFCFVISEVIDNSTQ
jgi:phenylacetate-CoA ligase